MRSVNVSPSRDMRATDRNLCDGVLIPWVAAEVTTIADAARYLGRSTITTRRAVAQYGLARHRPSFASMQSGTWVVSRVALLMFSEGDFEALTAYHDGIRGEAPVVSYYIRLGIVPPASRETP